MASLMLNNNATVTICHSKTSNLKEFTIMADILVVAVGKKDLITEDMVKDGAVVIDVGMNRVDNKLYGDVDFESIIRVLNRYGYKGPLTVEWEDSGRNREQGRKESLEFVRKIDFAPSDVAFDAAIKN